MISVDNPYTNPLFSVAFSLWCVSTHKDLFQMNTSLEGILLYFFFLCGGISLSISRAGVLWYRLLETLQCHFRSAQRAVDAFSEIYNGL